MSENNLLQEIFIAFEKTIFVLCIFFRQPYGTFELTGKKIGYEYQSGTFIY